MNTTEAQRAVLRALARKDEWAASLDVLVHDRKRTAGPFLGEFRTSKQVGVRLGQLVRMGLAERRTHYGVGQYQITPAGREVAGIPEPDPRQPAPERPAGPLRIVHRYQLEGSTLVVAVNERGQVGIGQAELDPHAETYQPIMPSELQQVIEQAIVDSHRIQRELYPDDPRPPAGGKLEWHPGKHGWETHDDYRRHAHSINGQLTIDPADTRVHFSGGLPFRN